MTLGNSVKKRKMPFTLSSLRESLRSSEKSFLMNLLDRQLEEKRKIRNVGIAMMVTGFLTLLCAASYEILTDNEIFDIDIIIFMTIGGSVMVIIAGALAANVNKSSIKKGMKLVASALLLKILSVIYYAILIAISIPTVIRQRIYLSSDSNISQREITIGLVVVLTTLTLIQIALASCNLLFLMKLREFKLITLYIIHR